MRGEHAPGDPAAAGEQAGEDARAGAVDAAGREVEREHVGLGAVDEVPRDRAAEVQAPCRGDGAQRVPHARRHRVGGERRLVDDEQRVEAAVTERRDLPRGVRGEPGGDLAGEAHGGHGVVGLERMGERHRAGDLELDDAVRGGRRVTAARNARPGGGALAVAVGPPAAAQRVGPEPLVHHVALEARQLRAERDVVLARDVRRGVVGERVGEAAHPGGRPRGEADRGRRPPRAAIAATGRRCCLPSCCSSAVRPVSRGRDVHGRAGCRRRGVDRSSGSDAIGAAAFPGRGPVACRRLARPYRCASAPDFEPDSLARGGRDRLREEP